MRIKVGLFFGGQSVEHEVSVISGIQALYAFDELEYEVIPIYITKQNTFYVGEAIGKIEEYKDISTLLKKSQQVVLVNNNRNVNLVKYPMKRLGNPVYNTIDVAFPVVHGTNVEDGTLQGYLRTLCIPYAGPDVTASAVGMDKYVMKTVLKDQSIPVLECVCCNIREYQFELKALIKKTEEKISYPSIVKPVNLGSSVGIKIAKNREELEEALDYAFQFSGKVMIERAITNLKEINCAVLGDYEEAEASECEEPINGDEILSYEDKYMSGGGSKNEGSKASDGSKGGGMSSLSRKLPADISAKTRDTIRQMAVETFQALNCSGVSRIDFMIDVDTEDIYVNEINTIPGSLSFYLWEPVGVKYEELLHRMVRLALKREREQEQLTFSFDTNLLSGIHIGGAKGSKS